MLLDSIRDAAERLAAQRGLDALLRACRHLLSERGEANGARLASQALEHYGRLPQAARLRFFEILARDFSPDPPRVLAAAQLYAQAPTAEHLIALGVAAEPPRQELLRRLNRAAGGTAFIVQMRLQLLGALRSHPELAALEADLSHLLNSWFNPGFLEVQQVDWNSSAQLLEKIIQHEAVHAIDGWDDLRRRLQPDRRCFAFFHPQLPDEPLIFVEVALLEKIPAAVKPLIDKNSATADVRRCKVAAFYSISNCQPGLRGVSLGNFLIKRVADLLKAEFPSIRTFCTLSPLPGFARWLGAARADFGDHVSGPLSQRWVAARRHLKLDAADMQARIAAGWLPNAASSADRAALTALASVYLIAVSATPDGDAVAKFHLGNGARLQHINWAADLSDKGMRESFGLMVNYLYDLDRVEEYRERFLDGTVVHARTAARQA